MPALWKGKISPGMLLKPLDYCLLILFYKPIQQETESDRKSTRLNSSHTEIYTLSLHDALPIYARIMERKNFTWDVTKTFGLLLTNPVLQTDTAGNRVRSEEHTSELQSHRDLHSFPTRRSSDLCPHYGKEKFHLGCY